MEKIRGKINRVQLFFAAFMSMLGAIAGQILSILLGLSTPVGFINNPTAHSAILGLTILTGVLLGIKMGEPVDKEDHYKQRK